MKNWSWECLIRRPVCERDLRGPAVALHAASNTTSANTSAITLSKAVPIFWSYTERKIISLQLFSSLKIICFQFFYYNRLMLFPFQSSHLLCFFYSSLSCLFFLLVWYRCNTSQTYNAKCQENKLYIPNFEYLYQSFQLLKRIHNTITKFSLFLVPKKFPLSYENK